MKVEKTNDEVFKMKFKEVYDEFKGKRLTCEEAAKLLGVDVRTFYRKRQRYDEEDFNGEFDRRVGKESPHKAADEEVEKITRLYNSRYKKFSVKHFHEFAQREHGIKRSYNWTKNKLIEKNLVKKSTRGGKHRLRRERRAMEGMMLHQDGSTHRWIPALDRKYDLIVTMDDATSIITSCFLVEEEGTESTLLGIKETIEKYGLFCSLYTDRGSHYFNTREVGGKVDKINLTQVGRALRRLGIEHIAAYSPEARGRSERMFSTLQARIPQELEIYDIRTLEEANKYIREEYIPRHNEQFSVRAANNKKAFIKWKGKKLLKDILCIQEERIVQKDNTIRYNRLILQIPKNEYRYNYIKCVVKVHKYLDGNMAVFHGHLCIGRYKRNGELMDRKNRIKINKIDKSKRKFCEAHSLWETTFGLRPHFVSHSEQNLKGDINHV